MIIERITDWDNTFSLWRASYKGEVLAYSVDRLLCLKNGLTALMFKYYGI
jgi:hypothetical protein